MVGPVGRPPMRIPRSRARGMGTSCPTPGDPRAVVEIRPARPCDDDAAGGVLVACFRGGGPAARALLAALTEAGRLPDDPGGGPGGRGRRPRRAEQVVGRRGAPARRGARPQARSRSRRAPGAGHRLAPGESRPGGGRAAGAGGLPGGRSGVLRAAGLHTGRPARLLRPSERIPDAAFQVALLSAYRPWMSGRLVYCDPFWVLDCVGLRGATLASTHQPGGVGHLRRSRDAPAGAPSPRARPRRSRHRRRAARRSPTT